MTPLSAASRGATAHASTAIHFVFMKISPFDRVPVFLIIVVGRRPAVDGKILRSHERETIPMGKVFGGRNWPKKPAESRLQPGLAAPQSRPIIIGRRLPTCPTKSSLREWIAVQAEGFPPHRATLGTLCQVSMEIKRASTAFGDTSWRYA